MPQEKGFQRYCELFYFYEWCFPWKPLSWFKFIQQLQKEGIRDFGLTSEEVRKVYCSG